MSKLTIDWSKLDERLPIGLDPESRKKRKKQFKAWDPNNNKVLSKTEIQGGATKVMDALGEEVRPFVKEALTYAFEAAHAISESAKAAKPKAKAKGKKAAPVACIDIDITEFHAYLVAFRKYLELAVLFAKVDKSGDRLLTVDEVKKALPQLDGWKVDADDVEFKFKHTKTLSYEDFADWVIRESMDRLNLELDNSDNEEVQVQRARSDAKKGGGGADVETMEQFRKYDADQNGVISEDELYCVLSLLNPKLTRDAVHKLITAADRNKDGSVDYEEFISWLFQTD